MIINEMYKVVTDEENVTLMEKKIVSKLDKETKEVISTEEVWKAFRYYSSLASCLTELVELVVVREGLEDLEKVVALVQETKDDIKRMLEREGIINE